MISREEPTEAVDYHAPFNPRADGYQSPAGSSSGSVAAIAADEWLDFTVAEDTSGSGRRPAAANGCFQYRPTHDLVDLGGMWPTFLQFDTPVILSRDLTKFASVASLWCNLESNPGALGVAVPKNAARIVYPKTTCQRTTNSSTWDASSPLSRTSGPRSMAHWNESR